MNPPSQRVNPSEWARTLIRGMVERYSPSGQEAGLARFLVEVARKAGWKTKLDEVGNFVAERGRGERTLLFLGHIDTVTGEIPVREEGGRLYGRGAVDAKGPLAAFLAAASYAAIPDDLKIILIGAVEEETSTSRGARHVAPQYQPDFLIIGEPSGWESICMGYRGNCHLRFIVEGPRSHGASDRPSAGTLACEFWRETREIAGRHSQGEKTIEQVSVNVGAMNTETDGLNETATMRLDIRTPPGVDEATLRREIETTADELGGRIEIIENLPPARGSKAGALVRELRKAIRAEGGSGRFTFKTGTSDMNIVAPAWGCPMVAYGPGDSSLDHTPDENLVLPDLDKSVAVLKTFIEKI